MILDISPNILLDQDSDEKLKFLMPYYNRDSVIQGMILSVSSFERFKNYSSIYPFNGTIIPILKSLITDNEDNNKGFIPLYGKLDSGAVKIFETTTHTIPERQLLYLMRILRLCKVNNINLEIVISPIFRRSKTDNDVLSQIKEIACVHEVFYFDFSSDSTLNNTDLLFKDNLHLNVTGAGRFSSLIGRKISLEFVNN